MTPMPSPHRHTNFAPPSTETATAVPARPSSKVYCGRVYRRNGSTGYDMGDTNYAARARGDGLLVASTRSATGWHKCHNVDIRRSVIEPQLGMCEGNSSTGAAAEVLSIKQ